jgi:hypothetical protein
MYPDPKILASCRQGCSGGITLGKSLSDVKGSDVVINDTLPDDSKRCTLSGKIGGPVYNGNNRRKYITDDVADFWDNKLCILIAVMIWIQE